MRNSEQEEEEEQKKKQKKISHGQQRSVVRELIPFVTL